MAALTRRDIPNLISVLRILLAVPLAWMLLSGAYAAALGLFVVAGASDGLDGYLAKHYGWTSRLGSILDPLADKVLLITAFVTLGWNGAVPVWLPVLVVGRDAVIVAGALAYHVLIGRYAMRPSIISKLNTVAQIVLVLVVVLHHGLVAMPASLLGTLLWVVVLTTVASGGHYVWSWGWRAWRAAHRSAP